MMLRKMVLFLKELSKNNDRDSDTDCRTSDYAFSGKTNK